MNSNVTTTNNASLTEAIQAYLQITGNKVQLTQAEQKQFLEIAQAYGLNPFKREIYIVAYGKGENRQFSLITGYEVYIKRAERSGKLDGWRAWVEGDKNNLIGIVEIYRKDWSRPFRHEVYFEEVSQQNKFWARQPKFMLKKVAIGQAFRLCFSDELGGMPHTADEVETEKVETVINVTPEPQTPSQPIQASVNEPTTAELAAQAAPPPPPPPQEDPVRIERRRLLNEIGTALKNVVFSDEDRTAYRKRIIAFGEDNHIDLIKELLEEVLEKLFERIENKNCTALAINPQEQE
jgi:phage recombination protein Bet